MFQSAVIERGNQFEFAITHVIQAITDDHLTFASRLWRDI